MLRKVLPFLFIFTVVTILYYPILNTFFSQDDFFHFKVSMTDGSLKNFINLFGFHPFEERRIAFYRPISRELLFNPYYSIFGLNHFPFRILQLLIHFINIFLVFVLIEKIFKKKDLAYLVAFFFGIAAANVGSLYYLAGGIQAQIATSFIITTLISYIDFLQKQSIRNFLITFFAFLLALGSHELSAVIPILLILLTLVYLKLKSAIPTTYKLWPFFVILTMYIYVEIFVIGFSSSEIQYNPVFNVKTNLNSFFWYTSWAFSLPEMLIDFVYPGFKLNPNLMRYWGNYFNIIFATFFLSVTLLTVTIGSLIYKKRLVFSNKKFLFLVLWFPISLLPVIMFPLHKSTYYLSPVLPPFWGVIGFIIFNYYESFKNKIPRIAFVTIFLLLLNLITLSIVSIKLGEKNFWASQRGKIAEKIMKDIKTLYPSLPKNAIVYIKNDPNYPFLTEEWGNTSKQASIVLNGSDAIQLLYRDPTIKVYYEDLEEVPSDLESNIFPLMARIY